MEAPPDTCPRRSRVRPSKVPDDFVGRHQAHLWRYLRFLGCPTDQVEDLLQDTFLAALQRDVQWQAPAVAAQWLRTTARNMFWMDLRSAARRPNRVALDLGRLDAQWMQHNGSHSCGAEASVHQELAALDCCLAALEPRDREALELRYRRGRSREEMASALGITTHGVKSLLRRLRQKLRRDVEAVLSRSSTDQAEIDRP